MANLRCILREYWDTWCNVFSLSSTLVGLERGRENKKVPLWFFKLLNVYGWCLRLVMDEIDIDDLIRIISEESWMDNISENLSLVIGKRESWGSKTIEKEQRRSHPSIFWRAPIGKATCSSSPGAYRIHEKSSK